MMKTITKEEKDLLLKDLCARLPYNVKVLVDYIDESNVNDTLNCLHIIELKNYTGDDSLINIKPYLRSMSSMTEEEREEYDTTFAYYGDCPCYTIETFDFLNKKHFDYRGLIPMGLAIEAPEDLYSNESEYNENGWKDLGNGLKVNRSGHVKLTEKERKRLEDSMYDENGWKDLGNGLKMDKDGHIAGGLKLK